MSVSADSQIFGVCISSVAAAPTSADNTVFVCVVSVPPTVPPHFCASVTSVGFQRTHLCTKVPRMAKKQAKQNEIL